MPIKTYAPFGNGGNILDVTVNISEGEDAFTIKGLSSERLEGTKDTVRSAIENSGYTFPKGQVDISLTPTSQVSENPVPSEFDADTALAVALAILCKDKEDALPRSQDVDVMAIGHLAPSGEIQRCTGVYAVLDEAVQNDIRYAIIPKNSEQIPDRVIVQAAPNLVDAFTAMTCVDEIEVYGDNMAMNKSNGFEQLEDRMTTFRPLSEGETSAVTALSPTLLYVLAVAIAGKHNLVICNHERRGSITERLSWVIPQLMSNLSLCEQKEVSRLYSIAGLAETGAKSVYRPLIAPEHSLTLEGLCGGGTQCRPGAATLAHRGVLFIKDMGEYRASVIQMLSSILQAKKITLSRAGRSTTFPADCQLIATLKPCACGNFGASEYDGKCICSETAVKRYQARTKKLSKYIDITYDMMHPVEPRRTFSDIGVVCGSIKGAMSCQIARQGKYNSQLTRLSDIRMTDMAKEYLRRIRQEHSLTKEDIVRVARVARTILDLQGDYGTVGYESVELASKFLRVSSLTEPVIMP